MVERMLNFVRKGQNVCVAFYGHPGVFVYPSHKAIKQARAEGYNARMLPTISSLDCLFADLGIDPETTGCQMFEATDFLASKRTIDISCAVIIWQIGVIGDLTHNININNSNGIKVLIEVLSEYYDPRHEAIVYEAPLYPIHEPIIQRAPISKISECKITSISTFYIPPSLIKKGDEMMLRRLNINQDALTRSSEYAA